MRPSGGPLWNLAVALASLEGRDGDVSRVETIRRAFDRPGARLRDAVAKEIGLARQQVCILVDQFEELFRYAREISRDESQLFIELLAGLTEDNGDSGAHAVVTLRSEFLGECGTPSGRWSPASMRSATAISPRPPVCLPRLLLGPPCRSRAGQYACHAA